MAQNTAARPPAALPALTAEDPLWLRHMRSEAGQIASSGLVPYSIRGQIDSVVLVGMRGRTLNLDLSTALAEVHVINGRTMCSAQLAGALARRAGHDWWMAEGDSEKCVIAGVRAGHPIERVQRVTFTIDDAKRAGLLDELWSRWVTIDNRNVKQEWSESSGQPKPSWVGTDSATMTRRDNWFRWPAAMLFARALTVWVRQTCGEVLLGLHVDIDPDRGAVSPAVDDRNGQVLVDDGPDDDDVVDAELVDDPPTQPPTGPESADGWPARWRRLCQEADVDRTTSSALIRWATEGEATTSVDVTDLLRESCERALDDLRAGRIKIDGEAIVEVAR